MTNPDRFGKLQLRRIVIRRTDREPDAAIEYEYEYEYRDAEYEQELLPCPNEAVYRSGRTRVCDWKVSAGRPVTAGVRRQVQSPQGEHPVKFETCIDGPIAVIGDVHGQTDKLNSILRALMGRDDYQDRWLVFIGDFVDRGIDARGTLDRVIDLASSHPKLTAVAGNHDFAMACALGLIKGHSVWRKKWVDRYNSESTFSSYECEHGDLTTLRSKLPSDHANFLAHLPWVVEHPDYVFVHAGMDMNERYEKQVEELRKRDVSLEWPEWLCSIALVKHEAPIGCSRTVVSGHVNVSTVTFRHKRICIDTTGGWKGPLSCVLLPENEVLTADSSA